MMINLQASFQIVAEPVGRFITIFEGRRAKVLRLPHIPISEYVISTPTLGIAQCFSTLTLYGDDSVRCSHQATNIIAVLDVIMHGFKARLALGPEACTPQECCCRDGHQH